MILMEACHCDCSLFWLGLLGNPVGWVDQDTPFKRDLRWGQVPVSLVSRGFG
jgi:hypothetical protein